MSERVVILVAGESGTGAVLLAKQNNFDVFVSDQGPIKDKYKAELEHESIPFEENTHTEEKILNASFVIKSPGIPLKAEIIKKIKAASISIIDLANPIIFIMKRCVPQNHYYRISVIYKKAASSQKANWYVINFPM